MQFRVCVCGGNGADCLIVPCREQKHASRKEQGWGCERNLSVLISACVAGRQVWPDWMVTRLELWVLWVSKL